VRWTISNFDRDYLQHILTECGFLIKESAKTNSVQFSRSDVLKRAFARSLEIIGEASKQLSPEFRNRNDSVDWKKISGMRDRIIHDYLGVDYDLVWDVARTKIPELKTQIKKLVSEAK
jgi:uncharacterized protein with HEPN domain